MGRAPCCDKANVKKGPWSPEEDMKLKQFIEKHGTGGNWIALPHKAGLKRCGKSCRLRWLNYLRPNIKHGEFSDEEDRIICTLFASIGSRWSIIAAQLPGRTDNDIKNYWNTKLKKKLMAASMMPLSHTNIHHQTPYPSSLQTPPSTYKASNGMSYSLTNLQEPTPLMPSNLLMNSQRNTTNPTTTSLQVQEMNFMGPMQHYYPAKGSPHQVFGVAGEHSCSSSDGSCTQFSYGDGGGLQNGEHMGLEGYFCNGVGGFLGGNTSTSTTPPLDYYNLEEIKQFITSSSSSTGNGCNDFFNIDETKTQGKVMY